MSKTYIPVALRQLISEKHGGGTEADNLAFACTFCNRFKGSDIASVAKASGKLVRFYNPRTDVWSEHFRLEGVSIFPLTNIGSVTEFILQLNQPDRLLERAELQLIKRYPRE